jgi:tRNA threonylcarbamoyl adenosine modification protein (Sua5/YciO/YrdC/YwlC family)
MKNIKNIIKILSNNKSIIFPAGTIYGLTCNKQNNYIIYKILILKKRKFNACFSVIVYSINKLFLWIKNFSINLKLSIKHFLQKNLTIIFKKYNIINDDCLKKKTIAIRIPNIINLKLILKSFSALISTSVNENNTLQIINSKIIKKKFNLNLDFILKKNKYSKGIESIIINSINKKIIRKLNINKKILSINNNKSKNLKILTKFEIYNIIFYINLINNSINILYKNKINYINFGKMNIRYKKNKIKYINILLYNFGNYIVVKK